jgi:hypothetical protein
MAEPFEFKDEHAKHGQTERKRRMTQYLAAVNPQASLADDHRALAALAALVYKSNHDKASGPLMAPAAGFVGPKDKLPGTTVSLPHPPNKANGFDGVAFYRPAAQELILVNRGTETKADWIGNARAGLKGWIGGAQPALNYGRDCVRTVLDAGVPLKRVICTGHSLGGALSEIQALFLNQLCDLTEPVRAIGFASAGFPGVIKEFTGTMSEPSAVSPDSRHYVRLNDPIRSIYGIAKPRPPIVDVDTEFYEVFRRRLDKAKDTFNYVIDDTPFGHSSYLYFYLWGDAPGRNYVKTYSGALKPLDLGNAPLPYDLGYQLPADYQ